MHSSEIYHFGIKGMKWGVRRTDEELGNDTNNSREVSTASTIKVRKTAQEKALDRLAKKEVRRHRFNMVAAPTVLAAFGYTSYKLVKQLHIV